MSIDYNNTTVRAMFNDLVRRYEVDVLGAEISSDQDKATRALLPDFERLWYMMSALGVVSPNEQLDDISTSALELLWTPYVIADLYQRVQGAMAPPDAASSPGTSNAVPTCGMTREEALGRSHRWYDLFFQWALQCELVDERTLEKYRHYRAEQRTQRVELSQMCRELKQELSRCEDKVSYLQAKRRRMQQLMEQDGDELADEGGEEEEALRCRALARLRWSVYESCHQLQLSVRELEMLQALSLEKRAEIAAAHDRTLEAVRRGDLSLGRHTYTILPGGLIAPGGPFPLNQINSTAMNALANQHAFRQQVIDQLMIDRNTPTMTLAEFAEAEMADLQRRMDENAEAQRRQQEEDERLGPDGVEERQRQRDAKLADWKDDHAPIGQTAKGNYA